MSHTPLTPQQHIAYLEGRRRLFLQVVGGWPPNVQGDMLQEARNAIQKDLAYVVAFLRDFPGNLAGEEVYADLLRMAHNADVPEAGAEAQRLLLDILGRHPESYSANLSIACLYVCSSQAHSPDAERYFRKALELKPELPDPAIYQGLGFSLLYQGKTEEATAQFEQYLKHVPGDTRIAGLLNKLASGEQPRPVYVESPHP